MGIAALATGLFSLGAAAVQASAAKSTQAANAAAQSELNEATMNFNRVEAEKARSWQSEQGEIERGFNAQQAELSRQFQMRMTSSAHQMEVADLKAAGLNPILTATGGSGAPNYSPVSASAGSIPMGSTASVSGLQAPRRENYIGSFVNTAMEGMRLDNDIKRAKATELEAKASWENSQTNIKRQAQDALESMERITNIKSETDLNKLRSMSESERVKLYKEQILSEVQERLNKKNISEATVYNLHKCAEAAATAAGAQASMAALQSEIQHAESPERIAKLKKEANYYQSLFDKNKWVMEDPKEAARRKWWRENPEAAHANEMLDIVGNVVHGNVSLHGGN